MPTNEEKVAAPRVRIIPIDVPGESVTFVNPESVGRSVRDLISIFGN